jgi:glycosyltransferase involved in cell wall biosynthesis
VDENGAAAGPSGTAIAMSVDERISVIIPAFNAAAYLSETLQATLDQTYAETEIVVVDDASSDDTLAIAQQFGERVHVVRHDRQQGVSVARNSGAARSTGTWLAFLDADDWWPTTFLAEARPLLKRGRALCYDNVVTKGGSSLTPDHTADGMTLHRRALPWQQDIVNRANLAVLFDGAPVLKSIVHRRDFDAVGGFDSRFTGGEDFHYHIKLAANDVTLAIVDEPYGFYRIHTAQTTAAISGGKQRNLMRHLGSCREWIRMYDSMPREIALDPVSLRRCAVGSRYWRYRYARAAALIALRTRDWRVVINPWFVTSSVAALSILSDRATNSLRQSAFNLLRSTISR